jgi:hypothetical protein
MNANAIRINISVPALPIREFTKKGNFEIYFIYVGSRDNTSILKDVA